MLRIFGIDPGLLRTGWGVIAWNAGHLRHIAHGTISPPKTEDLPTRLRFLHDRLQELLEQYRPHRAAVENSLVNCNAETSLKLACCRGVALLAPALFDLPVHSYRPTEIKKTTVGVGRASKHQVQCMVRRLLPGCSVDQNDAADALAVAICEAAMQERNKLLDRALSKRALPEAPRHRASSACESRKGSRS